MVVPKGITVNRFNSKATAQVLVATLLSLGLTAGVTGVASAAKHSGTTTTTIAPRKVAFQGMVTSYVVGVLTVKNAEGTTKTFTVLPATKVLRSENVNNSVALAAGDRVEVRALSASPTVAVSVNILAAKAHKIVGFQGVVTDYTAAVSLTAKNAKGVSKTFIITGTTKILRGEHVKDSVNLAIGDRVVIRAKASAATVAISINILGAK